MNKDSNWIQIKLIKGSIKRSKNALVKGRPPSPCGSALDEGPEVLSIMYRHLRNWLDLSAGTWVS